MSLSFNELKSVIREKTEDFLREARCPECDTILLWFEPGAVFGARILTALCSKCGIFITFVSTKSGLPPILIIASTALVAA